MSYGEKINTDATVVFSVFLANILQQAISENKTSDNVRKLRQP
jgi:hypothetical protein